jgi:DNA-binding CsgD family transcriptional regulator
LIPESQLAEEGPRSTAESDLRRAHIPTRSSGPTVEHHDAEAGAVTEAKRVGVVHEHDVLRRGIAGCLEEDPALKVVFAVAEGPPNEPIDVAVVSSRALAVESFDCPVVLFRDTTASGPVVQHEAVYATLSLPQLTAEQLVASVRAAAVGLRVSEQEAQRSAGRLDERRLEVLRLLAAGETTKSISAKLAYSERTIKTVIRDLETELGTRSRAHAVAEAIRQGLIT